MSTKICLDPLEAKKYLTSLLESKKLIKYLLSLSKNVESVMYIVLSITRQQITAMQCLAYSVDKSYTVIVLTFQ